MVMLWKSRPEDHLVDVELLGVVGVLGRLEALVVEPAEEAVEEEAPR